MESDIRFYEELKQYLHEEAARLIAERTRLTAQLATKADLKELEASILRWMLTFFLPLWLGVFGVIITLLVQG